MLQPRGCSPYSLERERERELTPWWAEPHTDCITETISVFFVNLEMPRKPLSCWRAIVMAAPPMKPTTAAWDRKSIRKPNLIGKAKLKLNQEPQQWNKEQEVQTMH